MGQCFSAPLSLNEHHHLGVGGHGRETEEKYRAKWNDIGFEQSSEPYHQSHQRMIKAHGVTATTVCIFFRLPLSLTHSLFMDGVCLLQADLGINGKKQHGERMMEGGALAAIDEHQSLRISSPHKQSGYDPASPMKNAVVRMSNNNSNYSSQPSGSRPSSSTKRQSVAHAGVPKNWTCGDLLGQGAFGSVYRGMDNDTGTLMAVKQVSLGFGSASAAKVAEHIKSVEAEVNLLKQLDHPNIVRYLGTEKTSKVLNIFLEYVPGGSIASLLSNFGHFKEPVVKLYTKQILLGLEYLHKNAIMHRDIKGANILVDNAGLVKLADFGASKKIEDLVSVGSGANSVKGTPYWMAPEVITQTGHGRQADIWSVACTVIEMATGKPPWSEYGSQVSAMFNIAKSKGPPLIPQELSPECKDFLYLCFNRNWRERPSAATLLDHPFVANVKCPSSSVSQQPRFDAAACSTVNDSAMERRPGARRQLQLGTADEGQHQANIDGEKKTGIDKQKYSSPGKKVPLVRASAPVFSAVVRQNQLDGPAVGIHKKPTINAPESLMKTRPVHGEGMNLRQTQIDGSSDSSLVGKGEARVAGTLSDKPDAAVGESTGSGTSHGSSFNPVEEPDAIHQQAKNAVDSLKASIMMKKDEVNVQDSRVSESIGCIPYSQTASLASSGSGTSCVKYSKQTSTNSSLSGKTTRSNGPIVYTIAADGSQGSSVAGLPWDLSESWTSGSKQTQSSGQRSSQSRGRQTSGGSEPRLQTIPSGSLTSLQQERSNNTSGHGTESWNRDLSGEKSWSSTSTHSSKGDDMVLPRASNAILPRAASSKEFQTPRKVLPVRSAASTPGQTPSRIPRAPLPDYSPRTMEMRAYAAKNLATPRRSLPSTPSRHIRPSPSAMRHRASIAGEHVIGTYEQKHLKQMERKRSSSTPAKVMGPPPPANAHTKQLA